MCGSLRCGVACNPFVSVSLLFIFFSILEPLEASTWNAVQDDSGGEPMPGFQAWATFFFSAGFQL